MVQVELGWKPVKLLVELNKLRFLQRVMSESFQGSQLLRSCMEWNLKAENSFYTNNLMSILSHHGSNPQELLGVSKKQLHQVYELRCLTQIQEMTTLRLLPIPRKWWTLQIHVENCRWSRMLIKFRTMNAGLGNRDSFRTADSISQDGGRVLQCPLCFQGSNDEFHLLMKCTLMD